jgi:hypothetical protein
MTKIIRMTKTAWDKTSGYKTASSGVLLLLFQLFKLIWPDLLIEEWEEWVYNAIAIVGGTGVIDKIWRSRKELIKFIKRLFKKEKEVKNDAG